MFFLLSKTFGFFAIPSNLTVSLGLLGLLLLPTRFVRAGRRLVVASLVILAILGLSPLGNALILPLEQRFPPWDAARGAPDGIVVLGGSISPEVSAARNVVALNEAAERVTVIAELARRYGTGLPDVLLLLDLPVQIAVERLRARGDVQGELHEQAPMLEQLRRLYHDVADYLKQEHPETDTFVIDAASSGSVDDTLREVMRRAGMIA